MCVFACVCADKSVPQNLGFGLIRVGCTDSHLRDAKDDDNNVFVYVCVCFGRCYLVCLCVGSNISV